jgi:hypothetical protein
MLLNNKVVHYWVALMLLFWGQVVPHVLLHWRWVVVVLALQSLTELKRRQKSWLELSRLRLKRLAATL